MGQSRKQPSRAQLKQRRRLKQIQERGEARENKKSFKEDYVFGEFFKNRSIELLFIGVLILSVIAIMSLGPDRKAMKAMQESVSSFVIAHVWEWEEMYPLGYKILALSDENIIQTTYDTLPKELKINWEKVSIERIQDRQLTSMSEKIRIKMSNINYAPSGISGLSVTVSVTRQKGATSNVARLGDANLIVQIVEDTGGQVFCLFGLR